ncbi:hypothetical protein OIU79_030819 [Salix purpurea]|uniref:Uncharacterized protein n=1 Tax=Salix purpurea TaxID=77065 RepID=A0A9Q0ZS50_SALPP|nr:hypothetical protein OIU79_030819 [Salix purpurea]
MKEQEHKSLQTWKMIPEMEMEIMITIEGMVMFQAQVSVTEGRESGSYIYIFIFFPFYLSFIHMVLYMLIWLNLCSILFLV